MEEIGKNLELFEIIKYFGGIHLKVSAHNNNQSQPKRQNANIYKIEKKTF